MPRKKHRAPALERLEDRTTPAFSTILSSGHVDLGLAFEDGKWEPHIHQEEPVEAEFEPDEALLHVPAAAKQTRPAGDEWNFLGVAAGQDVWILPQIENPDLLYLGIATEEIEPGTFAAYYLPAMDDVQEWVMLRLLSVRGPGQFSIYTTGIGDPKVLMATSDGIDATDVIFLPTGSHMHANYAFTKPGIYEVTFVAGGYDNDTLAWMRSKPFTYTFGVEQTNVTKTGFDIRVLDVKADPVADTVEVEYEIVNGTIGGPIQVGFYSSVDAVFNAGDRLLQMVAITEPSLLTMGTHTLTLQIGTQLALPGRGRPTLTSQGQILAVFDPRNLIAEDDAHPFREDNTGWLRGAYGTVARQLFVFGTQGDDNVVLTPIPGGVQLNLNGDIFSVLDVAAVRAWLLAGNDTVDASAIHVPTQMWGWLGNDTLIGGRSLNLLYGGHGDDTLTGGPSNDLLFGGPGNDILNGLGGNDLLHGGPGTNAGNGGDGLDRAFMVQILTDVEQRLTRFVLNPQLLRRFLTWGLS